MTPRLVAGALAVFGLWLWWWWPGEHARIRARLDGIAAALSAHPDETDLERMAHVASMASALAEDIHVEAEGRTLAGREAALGASRAVTASRRALTVAVDDAEIVLAPDATRADAHVVATIDGHDGERAYQELTVSLRKHEGAWVVDRVIAETPLRRPGRNVPP